jgi:hypothetical protein
MSSAFLPASLPSFLSSRSAANVAPFQNITHNTGASFSGFAGQAPDLPGVAIHRLHFWKFLN